MNGNHEEHSWFVVVLDKPHIASRTWCTLRKDWRREKTQWNVKQSKDDTCKDWTPEWMDHRSYSQSKLSCWWHTGTNIVSWIKKHSSPVCLQDRQTGTWTVTCVWSVSSFFPLTADGRVRHRWGGDGGDGGRRGQEHRGVRLAGDRGHLVTLRVRRHEALPEVQRGKRNTSPCEDHTAGKGPPHFSSSVLSRISLKA